MRILLLNQFFYPDSVATSLFLTDVARELARQGHEVIAVCGSSEYVKDEAQDGPPDVEICRTPTFRFARGTAARLLSYGSFLASAVWHGLLKKKPDVVLTLTTPPLLSVVGTLMKYLRGTDHWIWEMDIYPDVAVELGWIKRGSLIDRALGALADFSRRKANGVLVLGECMKARLLNRGIPEARLHVTENWADGARIVPRPFPDNERIKVLYSGNLGLAHEVETVKEAMIRLDSLDVSEFVFAGGGATRKNLQKFSSDEHLTNVSFRDYCGLDQLGESLADSDIGLVTQKPECLGTLVPSKIYGIMAAGRPILFVGPKNSTPHRIIQKYKCGWQIDSGDAESLVKLLQLLAEDRRLIYEAGACARRAFDKEYDLPLGVGRIAAALGAFRMSKSSVEPPGRKAEHHYEAETTVVRRSASGLR